MFRPHGQSAIVCSYLTFTDPRLKRPFRLPLVHIRLKQGNKSFRTDALVDSGATATFVPIDLMNILGFDLEPEGAEPPEQSPPMQSPTMQGPPMQGSAEQTVQQQKKQEKHQAVGAGGLFGTYEVTIDCIEVLKGRWEFCSLPKWKVLVPDKEGAIPHAVLGRDSIFRRYDITYRERKEEIVFRKPKK